jgi:hypothetical protein
MAAVAGLCYETSTRGPDSQGVASQDCTGEGRSLPSIGQIARAAAALGNVAGGNGEWTDNFYFADGTSQSVAVNNTGAATGLAITSNLQYRCVLPLLR